MISILSLGSISIIFYIIWHVLQSERERRKHNNVPGPYDFPLIGSTLQLIFAAGLSGCHYERFHRICVRLGRGSKTVYTRTAAHKLVITEDPELVKEVLNSPDWTNRFPDHPRFKEQTLYQNIGLMWSGGEANRELRKFTIRTLRYFGFGELKTSEKLVQEEIKEFLEAIDSELENSTSVKNEIFMQHKFKIPSFNILWLVMAGERFNYKDTHMQRLIHAVDEIAKINIGLDPEWIFPILRFIPGCSPSRAKTPSFVICHDFFVDLLQERRLKGTYKEIQNDFVDYFIHKIDQEKDNPRTFYTDAQFQVTCVDLLFGGLDTTANLLEFSILYMTKFPWVQKKVQAEIDAIVGAERSPSLSDRPKLKYVEAVMLEALRFACIVPVNGRTAACDTKVGSYNVEKETLCILNTTIVHMSKEVWGDPEVFRPERFLNENNEIINSDKIFPFGGGKRQCPGYSMAKVIWISFFTALMQRYNFSVSPAHPELSTIPDPGVANKPKPFYCIITPR